jgi:GNAT superfamily N-acetyltransferase
MTEASRPDSSANAQLTTRSGLQLIVRPAAPEDEALLAEFFTHVTPEDLRYRFLTSLGHVGHEWLKNLVEVDHARTENFLAFDAGGNILIATAMLAAEPSLDRAEVAIATRSDFKNRGVGWTMLEYVSDHARAKGIKTLESIECRDNRSAIDLEQEMGFTPSAYPGDPTLVLVTKNLAS